MNVRVEDAMPVRVRAVSAGVRACRVVSVRAGAGAGAGTRADASKCERGVGTAVNSILIIKPISDSES